MSHGVSHRHSLFTVWRWRWQVWCGVIALALLAALSLPPAARQIYARTGYNQSLNRLLCRLEEPLQRIHPFCPALCEFHQWESAAIDRLCGPPDLAISWQQGMSYIQVDFKFPDPQSPTGVPIFAGPLSILPRSPTEFVVVSAED